MGTKLLGALVSEVGHLWATLMPVDPDLRTPLAIALGAVPGALSRYYLTRWCTTWLGTGFPYGTFLVNLSGALLMGFFTTLVLEKTVVSPDVRALVAVGFLGAYTTFSTYVLDTVNLMQGGSWHRVMVYWGGSAMLGIVSLGFGSAIARKIL
ncbi:MAG: fluoride efflux transporter CrcB [Thermosynechococcaceae cyanobacterium]